MELSGIRATALACVRPKTVVQINGGLFHSADAFVKTTDNVLQTLNLINQDANAVVLLKTAALAIQFQRLIQMLMKQYSLLTEKHTGMSTLVVVNACQSIVKTILPLA